MKKIAALLGDYWHDFSLIKESLEAALVGSEGIEVEYIDHQDMVRALSGKPDAVILYKEDRLNPADPQIQTWMTPETAAAITSYVEEGGAWLAWHSGLAEYPADGVYIKMLRGYFKYHPSVHQLVTYSLANAGDTDATKAFVLRDEQYFVECDPSSTQVFLTSASVDGESIAGWSHPFGAGRVCCFTPAHPREALLDPHLTKLLGSRLHWCLERD